MRLHGSLTLKTLHSEVRPWPPGDKERGQRGLCGRPSQHSIFCGWLHVTPWSPLTPQLSRLLHAFLKLPKSTPSFLSSFPGKPSNGEGGLNEVGKYGKGTVSDLLIPLASESRL